jgi:hypothetical protein
VVEVEKGVGGFENGDGAAAATALPPTFGKPQLSPGVTGVSAPHTNPERRAIISMTADNKWLKSLMEAESEQTGDKLESDFRSNQLCHAVSSGENTTVTTLSDTEDSSLLAPATE